LGGAKAALPATTFSIRPVSQPTDAGEWLHANGETVGERFVASYRIYRVGPGGRLQLGEAFTARSDEAAVELARSFQQTGGEAELWAGGRLLGRFSKQGDFMAGVRG
jgi:hypothetical protein